MKLRYNILFFLFLIISCNSTFAKKKIIYPIADIPQQLLSGADAVVREKTTLLEVFSESKVIYFEKYVITILKESAEDKALFEVGYDKFSSVSNISATVYDAEGKKVKSIPISEIRDFTAISGFSLYEDSRVKVIDPKQTIYPYTVEYSWVKKYNSAFYIHGWNAFQDYNSSVEKLSYKLKYPSEFKINYKEFNLANKAVSNVEDDKKVLEWGVTNYKAPQYEALSDNLTKWTPAVRITGENFELDGYAGSFKSWKEFGQYISELKKGRDNVPAETIKQLKTLLKEDMTDYEKISAIYKYSQNKNRYVSIQEGIGGWQPFDAETVDRLSYGDCKALSNYVVTLLNNLGYQAYYTLIYAGEQSFVDKDFIANSFNHIVACVPLKNDTIWLECTSSYKPCGYLGDSTDDRFALLIKEEGGELVKTPAFSIEENNQFTSGIYKISPEGEGKCEVKITYRGAMYDDQYGLVIMDETDRRKRIIKSIDIPHFDLLDYKLVPNKVRNPSLDKVLTISIPGFASKMGDRLFFSLNGMNQSGGALPYSRNRKSPMLISKPFSENDSITYELPEGYKMEALPEPVEMKSEFGEYRSHAKLLGDKIIYKREVKIRKGQYAKEKYNDFVEFLEKVSKHDEAKAVLIKNT